MSIQWGHGLLLEEWVRGEEMKEATDILDDNCDTSSDGRLDGWDFNSDQSLSSHSSDSSSSGSEGDDAHTPRDKGASKSDGAPEPGDQGGVDQPAAAATGAVDQPGAAAATRAATEPSAAQRKSGRQNRFGGAYCAPRRQWGSKANHKAGPGQIAKVLLPEEAGDSFAALKLKGSKGKRAERRERLPQQGTRRATVKQARGRRTRKHYTRRKAQLMETYRKAYARLHQAEKGGSFDSVVDDPETMLDSTRMVHTCRVINAVKTFLFFELQHGVAKMEHSRTAANFAEVESKVVRRWVKEFCEDGTFRVRKRQYNKRQPHSYIHDEDIRQRLREYLDQKLFDGRRTRPAFEWQACKILSELKAFRGQLNKVEKFFKEAGYLCVFLPKYHPELNAIERYWGHIKYLLRLHCECSLPHMLEILPGTMRDVPVEFTRAWSRVTWPYIAAYDDGLVEYLKSRDLTQWTKHQEATARGDQVVEARGGGKTAEEKKAAEEKALAAAQ